MGIAEAVREFLFERRRGNPVQMIICLLMSILLATSLLPTAALAMPVSDKSRFADVEAGSWYVEDVSWIVAKGIMTGYDDGTECFGVGSGLTRAELAQALANYAGADTSAKIDSTGIADLAAGGMWYTGACNWAVEAGVMTGYTNNSGKVVRYAPNDPVTREMLATVLMRYAAACGIDTEAAASLLSAFPDGASVSAWAAPSLAWAVKIGMVEGAKRTDGKRWIEPSRGVLREEAAKMIRVAVEEIEYNAAQGAPSLPSTSPETHDVSYLLVFDEYVMNADEFELMSVADGSTLSKPVDPKSYVGEFEGWYADLNFETEFDFTQPIEEDTAIVAKWDLDETDSDSDGLYDGLEEYISSDPLNPDTDGDGLLDGLEIKVATSPLVVDTDEDGVSDFNEDYDEDGISNGSEVALGTDPVNVDTDGDDLSDGREVNELGTDPTKEDTDGDGADDGWEVFYGFDPLTYNETFAAQAGSTEATESAPVVASVAIELNGDQLSSLEVRKQSVVDNYLISPSIPGYMGYAYDFTVEGTFEKATLTFAFDEATFGMPDADFQPAIFYVNESTGCLERLPNQTISGNRVSAEVAHFSTYILLNEIPFNKVWESVIKPPETEGDSFDIVFAIDYSHSMSWNDPNNLRLAAAEWFIDSMMESTDRAYIYKFARYTWTVNMFSSNKQRLKESLSSIKTDDGNSAYSGTNGMRALQSSLDTLKSSTAQHKYIVLLTDGVDTYTLEGQSYEALTDRAVEEDVRIFTISIGDDIDENNLTFIAEKTGGAYYNAVAGKDMGDIFPSIGADIEMDIANLPDSNSDGIPDYFDELIFSGDMVLSNGSRQLKDVDFRYDPDTGELSDDYDKDGVKNGDELKIVVNKDTGGVYLKMVSDPTRKGNSLDTAFDSDSLNAITNWPIPNCYSKIDADGLLVDSGFNYPNQAEYYRDYATWIEPYIAGLYGVGKDDVYRNLFVDYIADYSLNPADYEGAYYKRAWVEVLEHIAANSSGTLRVEINNAIAFVYDSASSIAEIASVVNEVVESAKRAGIKAPAISVESIPANVQKIVSGAGKHLGKAFLMFDVADAFEDGLSACSAVGKANANNAATAYALLALEAIESKALDPAASAAAVSAREVLLQNLDEQMSVIIDAALGTTLGSFVAVVDWLDKLPYVKSIVLVKEAVGLAFGAQESFEYRFQLLACQELTNAYAGLFSRYTTSGATLYFSIDREDSSAWSALTDVAQMRILGEWTFAKECMKSGLIGGVLTFVGANDDIVDEYADQKTKVNGLANDLCLVVDRALRYMEL